MRSTGASFRSCSAAMARALRCRPTISSAPAMRWRRPRPGSRRDLDLVMRVALVPVAAIRAQGLDVRVARFGPSPNLSYAMFSGGGLGWADAAMKRGEFAVPAAPSGTQPDLTGLSCRFEEIPSTRGLILSVLVVPAQGRRSARLPQGDRGHHRAGRAQPGCGTAGAAGRSAAALAAGRRRIRGARRARRIAVEAARHRACATRCGPIW